MRVLWISVVSVGVLSVILLTARFWGLGQNDPVYDHPFFSRSPVAPKLGGKIDGVSQTLPSSGYLYVARSNSYAEIASAFLLGKDVIFWADVHQSKEGRLVLINTKRATATLTKERLGATKWVGNAPSLYTFSELQKFIPETIELKDLILKYPTQRIIINVVDNVQNIHEKLVNLVDSPTADTRILVQSDTHVILTSTKELKPVWLYGTSHSDIMRLLSFDSLFILPATPFHGDVYISPLHLLGRNVLNSSIFAEIRRRKKHILIGPISTAVEFNEAKRSHPDGFFLENPEISKRWVE